MGQVQVADLVYVVYKDDGNVCCGGSEVACICATAKLAEDYCERKNCVADKYPYNEEHHWYEEWGIISGLPEVPA